MPHNIERPQLEHMFSDYGDIVRITMKQGFAFVEFAEIEQAAEAIKYLNKRNKYKMKLEPAKLRPGE